MTTQRTTSTPARKVSSGRVLIADKPGRVLRAERRITPAEVLPRHRWVELFVAFDEDPTLSHKFTLELNAPIEVLV